MSTAKKTVPTINPTVGSLDGFIQLYTALAEIFEHPWVLRISHAVDGLPAFIVKVNSPHDDTFMYDERVFKAIKENMPPGYYDDGTCVGMEHRGSDGSREREYHIYPENR